MTFDRFYLLLLILIIIVSIFYPYYTGNKREHFDLEAGLDASELVNKQLENIWKEATSNPSKASIPKPLFETMGIDMNLVKKVGEFNPGMKEVEKVLNMTDPKTIRPKKSKEIEIDKAKSSTESFETSSKLLQKSDYCRVFTTSSREASCPPEYSLYTGATFIQENATMTCDGSKLDMIPAKAKAEIYKGRVMEITIENGGSHYNTPPHISIEESPEGSAATASAIATVNHVSGAIEKIDIIHSGSGYTREPRVFISKPAITQYCHLCCKKEIL